MKGIVKKLGSYVLVLSLTLSMFPIMTTKAEDTLPDCLTDFDVKYEADFSDDGEAANWTTRLSGYESKSMIKQAEATTPAYITTVGTIGLDNNNVFASGGRFAGTSEVLATISGEVKDGSYQVRVTGNTAKTMGENTKMIPSAILTSYTGAMPDEVTYIRGELSLQEGGYCLMYGDKASDSKADKIGTGIYCTPDYGLYIEIDSTGNVTVKTCYNAYGTLTSGSTSVVNRDIKFGTTTLGTGSLDMTTETVWFELAMKEETTAAGATVLAPTLTLTDGEKVVSVDTYNTAADAQYPDSVSGFAFSRVNTTIATGAAYSDTYSLLELQMGVAYPTEEDSKTNSDVTVIDFSDATEAANWTTRLSGYDESGAMIKQSGASVPAYITTVGTIGLDNNNVFASGGRFAGTSEVLATISGTVESESYQVRVTGNTAKTMSENTKKIPSAILTSYTGAMPDEVTYIRGELSLKEGGYCLMYGDKASDGKAGKIGAGIFCTPDYGLYIEIDSTGNVTVKTCYNAYGTLTSGSTSVVNRDIKFGTTTLGTGSLDITKETVWFELAMKEETTAAGATVLAPTLTLTDGEKVVSVDTYNTAADAQYPDSVSGFAFSRVNTTIATGAAYSDTYSISGVEFVGSGAIIVEGASIMDAADTTKQDLKFGVTYALNQTLTTSGYTVAGYGAIIGLRGALNTERDCTVTNAENNRLYLDGYVEAGYQPKVVFETSTTVPTGIVDFVIGSASVSDVKVGYQYFIRPFVKYTNAAGDVKYAYSADNNRGITDGGICSRSVYTVAKLIATTEINSTGFDAANASVQIGDYTVQYETIQTILGGTGKSNTIIEGTDVTYAKALIGFVANFSSLLNSN